MDYEGQKLAELIFYWIIISFGSVGWVIGYFQQDFTVVFQAWLVGVLLSIVVSVSARIAHRSTPFVYLSHHHPLFNIIRFVYLIGPFITGIRSNGSTRYQIGGSIPRKSRHRFGARARMFILI